MDRVPIAYTLLRPLFLELPYPPELTPRISIERRTIYTTITKGMNKTIIAIMLVKSIFSPYISPLHASENALEWRKKQADGRIRATGKRTGR